MTKIKPYLVIIVSIIISIFALSYIFPNNAYYKKMDPSVTVLMGSQIQDYDGKSYNKYENINFSFNREEIQNPEVISRLSFSEFPSRNTSVTKIIMHPSGELFASFTEDKSLIIFTSNSSKEFELPPRLAKYQDVLFIHWVGDNILLVAPGQKIPANMRHRLFDLSKIFKDKNAFIFDRDTEKFKNLNLNLKFDIFGTSILTKQESKYFLYSSCSRYNRAHYSCIEKTFVLSDSESAKEVFKTSAGKFTWGWEEDNIFVKQYYLDSSKISQGIDGAQTALRVFLINPEEVFN
jgi:hypothetical protein